MKIPRSQHELARLHKVYLADTEHYIKEATKLLCMVSPQYLMMGGELIRNETPFELKVRQDLDEQCKGIAKRLGLL